MLTDLGERLALVIDAKTDNAVSNVRRLSVEEKAAADRAEVLKAKLADLEARAARSPASKSTALQLGRTRSELAGLEATLAKVPAGTGIAERGLAKLGLQGMVTGKALVKGLAVGATAGAVFGGFEFLKFGVEQYLALADQIRGVQQAASSSAPDASKLVAITNALGVDANAAALGVFRLGKNIELTPGKLSKYDISVARTKTGNVDLIGTLENVAAKYQATVDPAKRAALVYDTFGKSGATMLPILNANQAAIKGIVDEAAKSGRIFSDSDVKKARDLQIAGRAMKDSFDGLAISVAKNLMPALVDAAHLVTGIVDDLRKVGGGVSYVLTLGHHVSYFAGDVPSEMRDQALASAKTPQQRALVNSLFDKAVGQSAEEKALASLQHDQDIATQQALANAALGTLAGGLDVLAGPEKLKTAKTTLRDAKTSLEQAVAARRAAAVALGKLRAGSPDHGLAVDAASARVTAAQANLTKAEYVGGDARIASARASLLSAQVALNKLRGDGTSKTDALAAAETRLHLAQEKVVAVQAKVRSAQKGVNAATGLTGAEVLARLTGQAGNQAGLAAANLKLAASGLSTGVIAEIDKLEQQMPGTLVKVAKGINAGIVAQLNEQQSALDTAQQQFADAASNPSLFTQAGAKAGTAYVDGFNQALTGAVPAKPGQRANSPHSVRDGGPAPTGVQINVGTVKVDSKSGVQLAADLAKHTRYSNLGTPRGASR